MFTGEPAANFFNALSWGTDATLLIPTRAMPLMLQAIIIIALLLPVLGFVAVVIIQTFRHDNALGNFIHAITVLYLPDDAFLPAKRQDATTDLIIDQHRVSLSFELIDTPLPGVRINMQTPLAPALSWLVMHMSADHMLSIDATGGTWRGPLMDALMIFDETAARRLQHAILAATEKQLHLRTLSLNTSSCVASLELNIPHAKLPEATERLQHLLTPLILAIIEVEQQCPHHPWDFWTKVFYRSWHHDSAQSAALCVLMHQCPERQETQQLWQTALNLARPHIVLSVYSAYPNTSTQWLDTTPLPRSRWFALMATAWRAQQSFPSSLIDALRHHCAQHASLEMWLAIERTNVDAIMPLWPAVKHALFSNKHPDATSQFIDLAPTWVTWMRPDDAVLLAASLCRHDPAQSLQTLRVALDQQFLSSTHMSTLCTQVAQSLGKHSTLLKNLAWAQIVIALLPFATVGDARQLCTLLLHFAPPRALGLLIQALQRQNTFIHADARASVEAMLPQFQSRATNQITHGAISLSANDAGGGLTISNAGGQLTSLSDE